MTNLKVKFSKLKTRASKKKQTNSQVYKRCVCIVKQYAHVKIHTRHAEVTLIHEILINHMLVHTSSGCILQAKSCRFVQEQFSCGT